MSNDVSKRMTNQRIDTMFRAIFQELKARGGQAKPKDLFAAVEPKLDLTPYEQERTSSGVRRWISHLRFYSIDFVKAGFLIKSGGYWSLTPEGEKLLESAPGGLFKAAQQGYAKYKRARKEIEPSEQLEQDEQELVERQAIYDQAKEDADQEIEQHINGLSAYEFQDLVAELLRAMGYHVSRVAPRGPDGGIDVVAYKDPLGTTTPRILVQVKHREQKVHVKEVREMDALLRKEGDVGLIVSSGGFTSEAEREIRSSHRHIETMDFDRLLALWQEHYDRIREEGKALLPLAKVYFLAPAQA